MLSTTVGAHENEYLALVRPYTVCDVALGINALVGRDIFMRWWGWRSQRKTIEGDFLNGFEQIHVECLEGSSRHD